MYRIPMVQSVLSMSPDLPEEEEEEEQEEVWEVLPIIDTAQEIFH